MKLPDLGTSTILVHRSILGLCKLTLFKALQRTIEITPFAVGHGLYVHIVPATSAGSRS